MVTAEVHQGPEEGVLCKGDYVKRFHEDQGTLESIE